MTPGDRGFSRDTGSVYARVEPRPRHVFLTASRIDDLFPPVAIASPSDAGAARVRRPAGSPRRAADRLRASPAPDRPRGDRQLGDRLVAADHAGPHRADLDTRARPVGLPADAAGHLLVRHPAAA